MTQSVFEFSHFSRVPLALKSAAEAFQPPIAFCFPPPVLSFFGDQAISGFLQGDSTLLKLR